jgi:hypothetical protein
MKFRSLGLSAVLIASSFFVAITPAEASVTHGGVTTFSFDFPCVDPASNPWTVTTHSTTTSHDQHQVGKKTLDTFLDKGTYTATSDVTGETKAGTFFDTYVGVAVKPTVDETETVVAAQSYKQHRYLKLTAGNNLFFVDRSTIDSAPYDASVNTTPATDKVTCGK